MQGRSWAPIPLLLLSLPYFQVAVAKVVPYIDQGFSFSYGGSSEIAPIPITAQCDTVRLEWRRGDRTGRAPTAPYFLQIFSSSLSTPVILPAGQGPTFDWQVPFAPRTQYQICMWDTFGVSGGCQAVYTMVPPLSEDTTCPNITQSTSVLDVALSPLSPPGSAVRVPVINQCSDLAVHPKSGSPPFTLTVAPSLHPPVNITSENMNPINWTVALPEGFPFFISLASADGLNWSNGPLYARGSGPTDCLSPQTVPKRTLTFSAVGASLGSLIVGVIIGIISTIFFVRRRRGGSISRSFPKISKPEEITPTAPPTPGLPLQMPSRASTPARSVSASTPPMSYPPLPPSAANTPPHTPDRSNFSFRSAARSQTSSTIDPFTETLSSPTSSHFPLDNKRYMERQRSMQSMGHMRAGSITTQASSSQLTSVSSSNQSNAPLLSSSRSSRRTSRSSRLTRAPTYVRHLPPPPSVGHLSVQELITDDASLIAGNTVDDLPPQYMMDPSHEERTVAGGRPGMA